MAIIPEITEFSDAVTTFFTINLAISAALSIAAVSISLFAQSLQQRNSIQFLQPAFDEEILSQCQFKIYTCHKPYATYILACKG